MNRFSPISIFMKAFMPGLLCFIFCVLQVQQATAQDFQFRPDVEIKTFRAWENTGYVYSSSHNDLTVAHNRWTDMQQNANWQDRYSFPVVSNFIKVGIDHDAVMVVNTPYKYKIILTVKGYSATNPSDLNATETLNNIEFIIENNNDSLMPHNDYQVRRLEKKYHKMDIQIAAIYKYDLNNTSAAPVNMGTFSAQEVMKNFFIESSVSVQRYDKLTDQGLVVNSQPDNNTHELEVAWAYYNNNSTPNCNVMPFVLPYSYNPVKFELEWTYIDDYKFNYSSWTTGYKNTSGSFSVPYDFRNNATRIQTYKNSFKIPIIYEHGTIVFRVRTIRPDPNNLSKFIYSAWSLLSDYGTLNSNNTFPISQINGPSLYCPRQCMYNIENAFGQDKFDWQYSVNFAEEGKYKHVLNFFDGAGHNRQTQTKINSDGEYIVAADHIYDYEGRPAIQTLPIPVLSQNLDYKNNLSFRAGSPLTPYGAADFDKGCLAGPIPAFDNSSLAGMYYSQSNPRRLYNIMKFVPDAEGYPFIHTTYSPDNTNKVLVQGGAGKDFQQSTNHVTANSYVRANQNELNRLFGTKAGKSAFYPKVITRDPNGQFSYSIFNQSGKVVATALTGGGPDATKVPIVPLDNQPAPALVNPTLDVLANVSQTIGDGLRSANYPFFPDAGGSSSLAYSGSISPYNGGCLSTGMRYIGVKGLYKARIVDECGSVVHEEPMQWFGQTGFLQSPAALPFTAVNSPSFALTPAKYTLEKELYFPDTAISRLAAEYTMGNSGISKCYDYEDNFIRKSVDKAIFPCKQSEEPKSHCGLLKRQMMDELYPGAKYGHFMGSEGLDKGTFVSGQPNSVFTLVDEYGSETLNSGQGCYYNKTCSNQGLDGNYGGLDGGSNGGNNNGDVISLYTTTEQVFCSPGTVVSPPPGTAYPLLGSPGWTCMNSDIICDDFKYRFQWGGCAPLPVVAVKRKLGNLMVSMNIAASDLKPDEFITYFNDQIAEKLLPFHPEYCKLLFCDDSYPEFLSAITSYKEAKILGVTDLAAIISQDPLLQSAANPNAPFTASELNRMEKPATVSLQDWNASPATIPMARTFDKQALENAYCQSESPEAFAYCRNLQYVNEINNLQFNESDTQVANAYIRSLISLYVSNRTIRIQKRMDAANNCGPCADFRMELTGSPVVTDVFDGAGSSLNPLSNPPEPVPGFTNEFNNALNGNTTTLPNTAVNAMAQSEAEDCEAELQKFKEALLQYHTGSGNGQAANTLGNTLAAYAACGTTNNTFTPQAIQNILGPAMNEYYNPYLAAYNVFDTKPATKANAYMSKKEAFYTGLQTFLSRAAVKSALGNPNSNVGYTFALSSANLFENDLATTLGISAGSIITVKAFSKTVSDNFTLPYTTQRQYMDLELRSGTAFDTLYLSKRVEAAGGNAVLLNNSSVFADVHSVLDDPDYTGSLTGTAADNMAFATLAGIDQNNAPGSDKYVIWSYITPMLQPKDEENIDNCINCVTIKKGVQQYFADAATLGLPVYADHPAFSVCLTNYLNYKLGKKHTYQEYESLMKGCALSNFFAFRKTPGQIYLSNLSPATLGSLLTGISNLSVPDGPLTPDYFAYANGVNSNVNCWIDLNSVPFGAQMKVKTYVEGQYGTTGNGYDAATYVQVLVPASLNPVWSLPAPALITSPVTVYMKNATGGYDIPYKKYIISGAGNPSESAIADIIDYVKRYCSNPANNMEGAIVLPSREVMRSSDYYNTVIVNGNTVYPKRNYLDYAYALENQNMNAADIAGNLAPGVLKGSNGVVPVIGNELVSYNSQWCPGDKHDLSYAKQPLSTDAGWARLNNILNNVKTALGGSKLFPAADVTDAPVTGLGTGGPLPAMLSLKVYKMSNGTVWYRFFDDNNKLYNVYLSPDPRMISGGWQAGTSTTPAGPPPNAPNGYSVLLGSLTAQPGSEAGIYRFKVNMRKSFLVNGVNNSQMVTCYGYTDFPLGAPAAMLKDVVLSEGGGQCIDTLPCERQVVTQAIQQGKAMYAQYIDSIRQSHILAMRQWFPAQASDKLLLSTYRQQYQYTLYNYDLVGNLMSTVPPMGVNETWGNTNAQYVDNYRSGNNNGSNTYPAHTKMSEYRYNSLNQLTAQKTPDGGETKFYYDKTGKLAFSQNAKQLSQGKFSYTLYDDQDRIKETGVVFLPWQQFSVPGQYNPPVLNGPQSPADFALNAVSRTTHEIDLFISNKPREEVVATFYDEPLLLLADYTNEGLHNQENLRKRVSSVLYIPMLSASAAAASHFSYGTHFSYDALGNVKTLVQDNPYMDYLKQRFKRVDYDYDLLSGKVNMVSYNRGQADQFYQRYTYDADNRITRAESSNDGLSWDRDAGYQYYKHGSLAEVQLGQLSVQSLQYAYTIQGWLKAINSDVLDSTVDMGLDGMGFAPTFMSVIPSDVVAHALDYYPGDYKPIGDRAVQHAANANTAANMAAGNIPGILNRGLYNGNIARQTTAIAGMDNLQRSYTYDQLNRIKTAQYSSVNNLTKAVTDMANAYANAYSYDKDGNILTLLRKDGSGAAIDNLAYTYPANTVHNNRLGFVADNSNNAAGLPGGQIAGNYEYDAIGNLVKDVQGNIEDIKWNAYGKVTDIQIDGDNKRLHFDYDAMGNRVRKDVLTKQGNDYIRNSDLYVRDASGNILAVYKGKSTIDDTYNIEWVNNHINSFHGSPIGIGGFGIAPFLADVFGSNGDFGNALLQEAQKQQPSWSNNLTDNFGLKNYLLHSPKILEYAIADNGRYNMPSLLEWNNSNFISNALISDKETFYALLMNRLRAGNVKYSVRRKTLLHLVTTGKDIAEIISAKASVPFTNEPEKDAFELNEYINRTDVGSFVQLYDEVIDELGRGNDPDSNFAKQLLADPGLVPEDRVLNYWDAANNLYVAYEPVANLLRELLPNDDVESSHAHADKVLSHLTSISGPLFNTVVEQTVGEQGNKYWNAAALSHFVFEQDGGIETFGDVYYSSVLSYPELASGDSIFVKSLLRDREVFNTATMDDESYQLLYKALTPASQAEPASEFMADWLSHNRPDWLKKNVAQPDRLSVVYESDKPVFIKGFIEQAGMPIVNSIIARIPQMSLGGYLDRVRQGVIRGTLNPSYDPPSVVTPDPQNLLADQLDLAEHHLYGSSRLGIKTYAEGQYRVNYLTVAQPGVPNSSSLGINTLGEHKPWYSGGYATWIMKDKKDPYTGNTFNLVSIGMENSRTLGMKQYELTDHLGNVLATVLDKKTGFGSITMNGSQIYQGFHANVSSVTDYYPFGMMMPGRSKSSNWQRFGFNGKEKDDEVYGVGNFQDYGMRNYDPRIARLNWRVDPLTKKYPELTPYQFASNTPIQAVDLDGGEALFVHGTWSDESTWNGPFVRNMLHATGWDKIEKQPLYAVWSGANNSDARNFAAEGLYNFLISDKNPYRPLKHVTLIGHSHGGNVNKVLYEKLKAIGWRVDMVNIETPQRKDFTSSPSPDNGVYLNFYNYFDLIQFAGTVGDRSAGGSRIDYSADKNVSLPESSNPFMPFNPLQWIMDFAGHSLHNNKTAEKVIVSETQKAFSESKKNDDARAKAAAESSE